MQDVTKQEISGPGRCGGRLSLQEGWTVFQPHHHTASVGQVGCGVEGVHSGIRWIQDRFTVSFFAFLSEVPWGSSTAPTSLAAEREEEYCVPRVVMR